MNLSYDLDEAEERRLKALATTRATDPALRSRANVVGTLVAAVVVFAAFRITENIASNYPVDIAADIGLVKWAWLAALVVALLSVIIAGVSQHKLAAAEQEAYPVRMSVVSSESGLHLKDGIIELLIPWSQVRAAEERGADAVVVWRRGVIAIPERAFVPGAGRNEFIAEIKRYASL